MRFGYFDDKNREYVITTPKTPYPWINYLGSENFFALVSHQAGGYCFYRDARLRRLMRYRYNNVPTDVGGRYFYINDGGEVWTPSFVPDQHRARLVRVPPRPRLHAHHRRAQGRSAPSLLMFVPTGAHRRDAPAHAQEHRARAQEPEALLVRRVLPVERLRRHDQLPAQLQHR